MKFGDSGETLVLNLNNELVKYLVENPEGEHAGIFCEQLYDLARISHNPLDPEQMTAFISRSNRIMGLLMK